MAVKYIVFIDESGLAFGLFGTLYLFSEKE